MNTDERTVCNFEPTGDRHPATDRPKWKCSRPGCRNVCWGEIPAGAWCQAERSVIAATPLPPPTFEAHPCPLHARGEVVGTIDCGCGGRGERMEVATCGLVREVGGNGYCTPRNLGNETTWRKLPILTQRPRACSTCALVLAALFRRDPTSQSAAAVEPPPAG